MIRKLISIPIGNIEIPKTIVTEISKNDLSFISESLKIKSELFFVTVVKQNDRYVLVDRYDVYLAALSSKIEEISAVVTSDSDCIKTHFQITVKSVMNPVKIINSMQPYVKKYGLDETMKKLHLNSDFIQMYKLGIDQKILDELNKMISSLYDLGVRTAVPLTLFTFIAKIEESRQPFFIESLRNMVKESNRHFRWPHNTFLKKLEMGEGDPTKKEILEKKLKIPETEFCCSKCDTDYVIGADGIVNEKNELENIILHNKHDSTPRILIPTELVEHLGVTAKKPPKYITSTDISVAEIEKQLKGRKFIIMIGGNQG
jgi:hypothetical protein